MSFFYTNWYLTTLISDKQMRHRNLYDSFSSSIRVGFGRSEFWHSEPPAGQTGSSFRVGFCHSEFWHIANRLRGKSAQAPRLKRFWTILISDKQMRHLKLYGFCPDLITMHIIINISYYVNMFYMLYSHAKSETFKQWWRYNQQSVLQV